MLELTKIKRDLDCNGWFYRTEIMDLVKAKYTTIDSYLQSLKKKGMVKHLDHYTKKDWEGGVLKLTEKGEREIKTEVEKLLSFEDFDESFKKIQPFLK